LSVGAQTTINSTFTGSGNGKYEDPADWSPQQVPNNSASFLFNVTIPDLTVDTGIDATISNLTFVQTGLFTRPGMTLSDHTFVVTGSTTSLDTLDPLLSASVTVKANLQSARLTLGALSNFSNKTLTGNFYSVFGTNGLSADLRFNGADIVTLNASVSLNGPSSAIVDEGGNDALRNLAHLDSSGSLELTAARTLTVPGDLTNDGSIALSGASDPLVFGALGARLTIIGTLTNFDPLTRTLTVKDTRIGGIYHLRGLAGAPIVLKFKGADIVNNSAYLRFEGPFTGGIQDESGNDGLRNFAHNLVDGSLFLSGHNMTIKGDFTNDGLLDTSGIFGNGFVKFNAQLTIQGFLTNLDASTKTLTGGSFQVGTFGGSGTPTSVLQFRSADIVHNNTRLLLTSGSKISDENGNDGLRNLASNEGAGFIRLFLKDVAVPGDFVNRGGLLLSSSVFTVASKKVYTQEAGQTDLESVDVTAPATINAATLAINGGLLDGTGTLNGAVQIANATLAPSDAHYRYIGGNTITINGSLGMSGDAHLRFTLSGSTKGNDFISVSGNATMGGALEVAIAGNFTPTSADTFTVLTAGSPLSGLFTNVASGGRITTLDGTGTFLVTYSGRSIVLSSFQSLPPVAKLLNISTRMRVLAGDKALMGGFIIVGTEPKRVMIRGIGPSLVAFGVPGPLADPTLELHSGGSMLATNDNWKTNDQTGQSQESDVRATKLAPTGESESAILTTLNPGAYTAVLAGKGQTSGVGLVEVYDIDQTSNSRLANISTRGFVDTGDNVMIGGFVLGPANVGNPRVLVRAIGTSMKAMVPGTLSDPNLSLHDQNGTMIGFNEDWQQDGEASLIPPDLKPGDSRESALHRTLAPGNYTTIVRGKGGTTGIGLVEVYNLH